MPGRGGGREGRLMLRTALLALIGLGLLAGIADARMVSAVGYRVLDARVHVTWKEDVSQIRSSDTYHGEREDAVWSARGRGGLIFVPQVRVPTSEFAAGAVRLRERRGQASADGWAANPEDGRLDYRCRGRMRTDTDTGTLQGLFEPYAVGGLSFTFAGMIESDAKCFQIGRGTPTDDYDTDIHLDGLKRGEIPFDIPHRTRPGQVLRFDTTWWVERGECFDALGRTVGGDREGYDSAPPGPVSGTQYGVHCTSLRQRIVNVKLTLKRVCKTKVLVGFGAGDSRCRPGT